MSAPCPYCGASTVSTQIICSNCGLNLRAARRARATDVVDAPVAESFVERYRGTEWETQLPPAVPAAPRPWWGLALLVGVPVILAALILASHEHYLDIPLSPYLALPLAMFVPVFAGWISKVVPGTKARGLFKGYVVAYVGTTLLGIVLFVLGAWTPVPTDLPIRLGWIIDQLPIEIAGAVLFRLVLLMTE